MPVSSRPTTKRLPLSSQSSFHNQPGPSTSSSSSNAPSKPSPAAVASPSPAVAAAAKKRLIRPVKSNPNLRPAKEVAPPLPVSLTYPVTAREHSLGSPIEEVPPLPPKVAFAPEIFVHRHTRDFPHLHHAPPPLAVPRRTSPAGSIASEGAVVALPLPANTFIPLSPPMSPLLDNAPQPLAAEEDEGQATPKKRHAAPRQLSLVGGNGLFGPGSGVPLPCELGAIHQEEVMAEEADEAAAAGMDDSRQSSEISSECNLSFTWEQSEPPRTRNTFVFATPPKALAAERFVAEPPRTRVAFAADLPPLGAVLPPTSSQPHERTVFRKSVYTPTSPTFDIVSAQLASDHSTFPAPIYSLPPTPVTPALSFHSSSTTSTAQFATPIMPPVPSMPSSMSANNSRPRPAHTRGPSIGYRHTPSPTYDPSSIPAEHQSPPSASQALPPIPSSSSPVSNKVHFWGSPSEIAEVEEEPNWRSTMSGAEELNRLEVEAAVGLLTKSRSDGELVYGGKGEATGVGVGLRERYLREGPQNFSLSRPDLDPRPQPDASSSFQSKPIPTVHLNHSPSALSLAPPSLAPSQSSWTSWLGSSSARRSRRASDQPHHTSIDATQMENGEARGRSPQSAPHDRQTHEFRTSSSTGTFGSLRPGWMNKRNASLPLGSPISHESSGSGSSFGNAPGEIFGPSPTSGLGFDWPSSPASAGSDRPSLFAPSPRMRSVTAGDALTSPAAAHTYRRPSTNQDASFAPLPHSQIVALPPTPNAPVKGLKPLLLSAPPKQLRKTLRAALMPTIQGSPSKRALEEGRSGANAEDDVDDYYTQSAPSTSVNISVHPATPMKHPAPPSPVLQAKTTVIPSHQRTYSSAFSASNNSLRSSHLAPSTAAAATVRPSSHLRSRSSTITQITSRSSSSVLHSSNGSAANPRVSFSSNNGQAIAVAVRPTSSVSILSMAQQVISAPLSWMEDLLPAQVIFFLGFCLGPWTWIIGGWGLSPDGVLLLGNMRAAGRQRRQSPPAWGSARPASLRNRQPSPNGSVQGRQNTNAAATPTTAMTTKRKPWILPALRRDNPNRWVYRCRVAAILSGLVVIPGLILAIVFSCI